MKKYKWINLFKKNESSKLLKLNPEKITYFTFGGIKTKARVIDVYDGDTCTVIFKYNKKYYKHKIRLHGYNSPELKPRKNIQNRDNIIEYAKLARDALQSKILGKIVDIVIIKEDCFGRLVSNIYVDKIDITGWMIYNGYGDKFTKYD